MKRAFLYMGLPKTATTSHQNAIHAHRDRLLRDYGILYPAADANHTNLLCPMFLPDARTHVTLRMKNITTPQAAAKYVDSCFAQMEAELAQPGWDNVILSAEGLANLPAPALKKLQVWLSGHVDRIDAVYWLRHPVSFTISVLQQMLKGGETIQHSMSKPAPVTNYHKRVENALRAFGIDALNVSCFEEALAHDLGPVGAFCQQAGIPEDMARVIAADASHDNESMSMMAGHLLDSLNRQKPMFVDGALSPERRPGDFEQLLEIGGPRFDLDTETRAEIRRRARPEIEWLTQTFGRSFYDDILDDSFEDRPGAPVPPPEVIDPLARLLHAGMRQA